MTVVQIEVILHKDAKIHDNGAKCGDGCIYLLLMKEVAFEQDEHVECGRRPVKQKKLQLSKIVIRFC